MSREQGSLGTPAWGRLLMSVLLVTPGLVLIVGLWVRYR